MLPINRSPLLPLVVLVDDPLPPSAGIFCRATASASIIISSPCLRDAILSASAIVTLAQHAGQRRPPLPLIGVRGSTADGVGEGSSLDVS